MGINLEKGSSINLTKAEPELSNLHIGLGWVAEDANGNPIDCDVSVFMLDANGKIPGDGYFIFYNNLTSSDCSTVLQGDNTTGEGDDEEIKINLSKVDTSVIEMVFVVTIHDADKNGQDFSMVDNPFIRILNDDKQEELCRYNLVSSFVGCDSVEMGHVYRSGDDWEFGAMETGYSGGLAGLLEVYN
jgi:tellurium resistance protein TerD